MFATIRRGCNAIDMNGIDYIYIDLNYKKIKQSILEITQLSCGKYTAFFKMAESTQNFSEFLGKWKECFYDVDIHLKETVVVHSIKAVLALHSPVFQALIR